MDEAKTEKKVKHKLTRLQVAVLAFLLGVFGFVGLRFITIKDASVHYHANFALYINGQKDEFDSFTFYEEVQVCSSDDANNVKTRVHLHDNNPSLVHVHHSGVTWGQLFANLGYGLTNKAVTTDAGVFVDGQDDDQLAFLLNGQPVMSIANEVIQNKDVLLVNYGDEDIQTLQGRAEAIPRDAEEANTKRDPSSCSGTHELSLGARLKAAFGIGQEISGH